MKLQLNTTDLIIKIEQRYINLNELYTLLEKLLPNGEWRNYDLECGTSVTWTAPPVEIPNPWVPGDYYPWITFTGDPASSPSSYSTVPGIYNVEIK
jgi:hypothetical protein